VLSEDNGPTSHFVTSITQQEFNEASNEFETIHTETFVENTNGDEYDFDHTRFELGSVTSIGSLEAAGNIGNELVVDDDDNEDNLPEQPLPAGHCNYLGMSSGTPAGNLHDTFFGDTSDTVGRDDPFAIVEFEEASLRNEEEKASISLDVVPQADGQPLAASGGDVDLTASRIDMLTIEAASNTRNDAASQNPGVSGANSAPEETTPEDTRLPRRNVPPDAETVRSNGSPGPDAGIDPRGRINIVF
jgi:hypothetical protein